MNIMQVKVEVYTMQATHSSLPQKATSWNQRAHCLQEIPQPQDRAPFGNRGFVQAPVH